MDYDSLKASNYPRQTIDWDDIVDLTRRWAKKFPEKMELNKQWVEQARYENTDKKFAEWKDERGKGTGTRKVLLIHPELLNYLETMYPQFLKEKGDVAKFLKKLPMFKVPDKV
jgi:transketolase